MVKWIKERLGLIPTVRYSVEVNGSGMYYGPSLQKAEANYEMEKKFARLFKQETILHIKKVEYNPLTGYKNFVYIRTAKVSKNE